MNEPTRLLMMPQLARRLGLFYSVIYKAFTSGELSADFALLNGSPLFEDTTEKLFLALDSLKARLSAEDFEEAKTRLNINEQTRKGVIIDTTDNTRPLRALAPFAPIESK